jgi:hypothetical protein
MLKQISDTEKLDQLQKEMVKAIQDSLKVMNINSTVSYMGAGYKDVERSLCIHVYKDKYNYMEMSYVFDPELSVEDYCNGISSAIAKGKYRERIASPEQIYITEIIEATKCKHLYILDRELRSDNSVDTVDLTSIDSLNYSKSEAMMTFVEDSSEKIIVDLAKETITWIEEVEEV